MNAALQVPIALKQQYIERRRADVARLWMALENGSFETLSRSGHQLKGNASTFGFSELVPIATALEDAADRKDTLASHSALASLTAWLVTVRADTRR